MTDSPAILREAPAGGRGDESLADVVVEIRGVDKRYGCGAPVLKNCEFVARQGECVFLAGPSGCGKTTLLSIIGCVLRPDRGEVRVLGRDPYALTPAAAAMMRGTHLGFVFQRFHLIRGLSALENVCVPLTLAGVAPAKAATRGRELLDLVGLAEHAAKQPSRLSVGQCQRVAFARALAADPPLILADEPTASLDAATGQQAMQLLRRLTVEAGKTAVVVTHDPRIFSYADRILAMEDGRCVEQSLAAETAYFSLAHAELSPLASR